MDTAEVISEKPKRGRPPAPKAAATSAEILAQIDDVISSWDEKQLTDLYSYVITDDKKEKTIKQMIAKEEKAIIGNMIEVAKSGKNALAIRTGDILMKRLHGTPGQQPAVMSDDDDIEQMTVIQHHAPKH